MKFRNLFLAALFASLFGAQALADTTDMSDMFCGRWYLAPEVLGIINTNRDVPGGALVGGRLGYQFDQNLAMEVESGWVRSKVESEGDDDADLDSVPLLLNTRYSFMGFDEPWDVFVMGGLGLAWNSLDKDSVGHEPHLGNDTSFVARVGTGTTYRFDDNWALVLELGYMWNNTEVEVAKGNAKFDTIDLDGIVAGGGIEYRFPAS